MIFEQQVLFRETHPDKAWIPLAEREPEHRPQFCAVLHLGVNEMSEERDEWHPGLEPWTDRFTLAPGVWMFPFCMCEEEYTLWYPLPEFPAEHDVALPPWVWDP